MDTSSGNDYFLQIGALRMHYRYWDRKNKSTVLLLHGALANEVWWRAVASQLKHNVIAVDLFGHGQSDWCDAYSLSQHASSVCELLTEIDTKIDVIVGHSYGGAVAAYIRQKIKPKYMVMLDTPLVAVLENQPSPTRLYKRPFYQSKEEALLRFRPIPPQPIIEEELFQKVASYSLVHTPSGWSWQFDPKLSRREFTEQDVELVKQGCKNGLYWYGEYSPFANQHTLNIAKQLGMQLLEIKNAYHAVLIDQPQEIADQINQLSLT
jgi:pimeloyl-ACP methyl ester carboxylesterase